MRRRVGPVTLACDLVGDSVVGFAILERGEAIAVKRGVGIGGIGVEGLADDETGFAMFVAGGADEGNIGGERGVAGNFSPNEVERIVGEPHVAAAAGDEISLVGGIVGGVAGVGGGADVVLAGEDAEGGIGLGGGGEEREGQRDDDWTMVHGVIRRD